MVLDYHDSFSEVSKIKSIKIVDNDPKLSSILYEDLETGELLVN